MPSPATIRPPRWYTIPLRVLLLTFLGTLLSFAVSLFFALLATVTLSALRGVHPDMREAYRHVALPLAAALGCVVFVAATVNEIRHYRQSKTLSAIERMG